MAASTSKPETISATALHHYRGLNYAAGPSEGGWTIVAVHESQASWERFRDQILMPAMQAGIAGGFGEPPQETAIEVDTLLP